MYQEDELHIYRRLRDRAEKKNVNKNQIDMKLREQGKNEISEAYTSNMHTNMTRMLTTRALQKNPNQISIDPLNTLFRGSTLKLYT